MTGQLVTRQERAENVRALLAKMQPELAKALPRQGLTPARFTRIALTTIKRTPKLLECSPESLLAGVMSAAQLGLTVDGVTGDAYLVPYKSTAVLIPGYRGLMRMARNSGKVAKIEARCVYEGDEFMIEYGSHPRLVHKPDPWGDREQGSIVGVYAVATLLDVNGQTYEQFEAMSVEEVEKVRARSMAAQKGPWVSDWAEMAKKTVVRRLAKYLPLDTEEQRALNVEEQLEAGVYQPDTEGIIDVEGKIADADAEDELGEIAGAAEAEEARDPSEDVTQYDAREEWLARVQELASDHKIDKKTLEKHAGGPLEQASTEKLAEAAKKLEALA